MNRKSFIYFHLFFYLEFSRQNKVRRTAESSSDSIFLQNVSSDAESDKVSLSHRRTSSDLSYEPRGRRRFSNLPAVRFMSNRYSSHFGTPKVDSRKCKLINNHISLHYTL